MFCVTGGIFMHKSILVPLDLEEPELIKAALDAARAQALASGARVRLMYAMPMVPSLYLEFVPAGFEKDEKDRAGKKLAQYAAELGLPDDRVSCVVLQGGIFHVVMAEAKKWKADLFSSGPSRDSGPDQSEEGGDPQPRAKDLVTTR